MAPHGIIGFTFILGCIVCGVTQTGATNEFDRTQLLGMWYHLAVISSDAEYPSPITCYRSYVTEDVSSLQNFKQIIEMKAYGKMRQLDAYGTIVDSDVHISFPGSTNSIVYTVKSYKQGEELILHHAMNPESYIFMSRKQKVRQRMMEKLEELATWSGKRITYFNQDCANEEIIA